MLLNLLFKADCTYSHQRLWPNTQNDESVLHKGVFLLNLYAVQNCHPFYAGEVLRVSERKVQAFSSPPPSLPPPPRALTCCASPGRSCASAAWRAKAAVTNAANLSHTVVEPLQLALCVACEGCWVTAFWCLHQPAHGDVKVASKNALSAPILPVFLWLKWQPVQISHARWDYTFLNEYLNEINSYKYSSENNSTVSRVG